jgi:hypothetical protein
VVLLALPFRYRCEINLAREARPGRSRAADSRAANTDTRLRQEPGGESTLPLTVPLAPGGSQGVCAMLDILN